MQADLLGRPIPANVKKVVDLNIQRTKNYIQWREENGRTPNSAVKAKLDIDFFEKKGLIDEMTASALRREYKNIPQKNGLFEPVHLNRLKGTLEKIAGAKDYLEWDDKVRAVAKFSVYQDQMVNRDVEVLRSLGLWNKPNPPKLTKDEYVEAGRKYVAWKETNQKKREAISAEKNSDQKKILQAEYLVWMAEDKPLHADLPSATQFETARLSPDDLITLNRSHMFQGWNTLSVRDRKMLGYKTKAGTDTPVEVLKGWVEYQTVVKEYLDKAPPTQRTIKRVQRDALAKLVDKQYPGFLEDYNFGRARLVDRFAKYQTFLKGSKSKSRWNEVFAAAHKLGQQIDKSGYPETLAKEYWKDAINEYVAYYSVHDKQWGKELKELQKTKSDFLYALLSKGSG
jgi:hypothetical protein